MNTDRDNMLKLLENRIEKIVRDVLNESKEDKDNKKPKDRNTVEKSKSFTRQYKTIQQQLMRPEVDATQIMAKALNFDPKDDTARSHAFKKLHREETPDGKNRYEFDESEIGRIANFLQTK